MDESLEAKRPEFFERPGTLLQEGHFNRAQKSPLSGGILRASGQVCRQPGLSNLKIAV
jgi:hypothetical protein